MFVLSIHNKNPVTLQKYYSIYIEWSHVRACVCMTWAYEVNRKKAGEWQMQNPGWWFPGRGEGRGWDHRGRGE